MHIYWYPSASKPDGTMRKVMDVSRINALGWKRTMPLKEGIVLSYQAC